MKSGKLSDEELTLAAGGMEEIGAGSGCWFKPAIPLDFQMIGNQVWVRCGVRCYGKVPIFMCECHSTNVCQNRLHLMEKTSEKEYRPSPANVRNHRDPAKAVPILPGM